MTFEKVIILTKLNKTENNKFTLPYRRMFIIFLVVCVISILFCFQYYTRLHSTIREESKNYLQEVSDRIGANINRIITDNYNVLYSMAAMIEEEGVDSLDNVRPALQKQQKLWDYEDILFVDEAGKTYDLDNQEIFVEIDASMRQDILNNEQSMSTTQIVNNKEYIFFSVPLQEKVIDGKKMVALAAGYDPAAFDQVLSMTSFNEQAYSQIITKSGTAITRSSSKYALQTGYNVFSSLQSATLDKGNSFAQVKKEIKNDKGNQIGFTLDGRRHYMVYTPIEPDEWYLLTFVPAKVINEKSDMLLRSTIIICALLTVTFAVLILLLVYVFNNSKRRLEQMAYVDEITGGNTVQRFYELARQLLGTAQHTQYALVYSNIENFKVLNEQLGRQNCDLILRLFNNYISRNLTSKECMGRIAADNFGILLEYKDEKELVERFHCWLLGANEFVQMQGMQWGLPSTEFGIYVIENDSLMFPQMIDRAKLALRESSRTINSRFKYAFYDDEVRRQMFREKQIEDMMDRGIDNQEFQVYFQPKYRLPEEKIGGAEALVRWISETEGMIYPNEFIPLFEKNGFIVRLDLYVFEVVCKTLRRWMDEGIQPVKISVNCSRVHFGDVNFLTPYIKLAEKYCVDRNYIEIELTESVVFENTKRLIKIIEEIREAGFGCSMDDFGSGYSSLNLIRSIPVDTLKMDKIFFDGKLSELERTEAVIESIVNMADALSMETVAEGVEIREQVEMLKRVGCNYVQGYVFAKPMQISEFEKLAFETTDN